MKEKEKELEETLKAHLIENYFDTEELDEPQLEGIMLIMDKVFELGQSLQPDKVIMSKDEYDIAIQLAESRGRIMGAKQLSLKQPYVKQWVSEWISVEDRLPEIGQRVLLKERFRDGILIGYLTEAGSSMNWKTDIHYSVNYASHWQPLPEPPNSTTTPKTDMVSKEKVLWLIGEFKNHLPVNAFGTHALEECITKIKEL